MKYLTPFILALSLISASSVQAVMQDFTDGGDMDLRGDAYLNENHVPNGVILTPKSNWKSGSAFTSLSYENIERFTADFKIYSGGGSGADGLTFAWVTNPDANTLSGGDLGFTGMTGYAVEFDTYRNSWDNQSANHVAIIQDSARNTLLQAEITDFDLNDQRYRQVRVEFDRGTISVNIDGQNYIDEFSIANYTAFDGYFGFTAATGGKNDWHKVKDFNLNVSPVPEPSTYALMLGGLGLIGFMASRRRKQLKA